MSTAIKNRLFEYVQYLWRDEEANGLDDLDRLVYRSNKLGEDLTLTNTGGGNTSSKLDEEAGANPDGCATGCSARAVAFVGSTSGLSSTLRSGSDIQYALSPVNRVILRRWPVRTRGSSRFDERTQVVTVRSRLVR